MNEFLAKFKQMDSKMRTILLGVLLLIVFVLDFLFLIRPQFHHYIKIGKNTKELQQNIDLTTRSVAREQVLRSEVHDAKQRIVALQERLTDKESMAVILERVSLLASQNRIDIKRMVPDINEPKILLDKNGKKYMVLPINLTLEAAYHDFGRFIGGLEQDVLFIRADKFAITAAPTGISKIDLTLKAMMFEGQKVAAENASGGN